MIELGLKILYASLCVSLSQAPPLEMLHQNQVERRLHTTIRPQSEQQKLRNVHEVVSIETCSVSAFICHRLVINWSSTRSLITISLLKHRPTLDGGHCARDD